MKEYTQIYHQDKLITELPYHLEAKKAAVHARVGGWDGRLEIHHISILKEWNTYTITFINAENQTTGKIFPFKQKGA